MKSLGIVSCYLLYMMNLRNKTEMRGKDTYLKREGKKSRQINQIQKEECRSLTQDFSTIRVSGSDSS